jgi:hypothetical protein
MKRENSQGNIHDGKNQDTDDQVNIFYLLKLTKLACLLPNKCKN